MEVRRERVCHWQREIAAYLDGELEPVAAQEFEGHLAACRSCAAYLNEQKSLFCVLDASLSRMAVELPADFASVVTVNARADVGRVRSRHERRRAALFILALAFISFTLIGGTASAKEALAPVQLIAHACASVTRLMLHALFDVGRSIVVIGRIVGQSMIVVLPGVLWLLAVVGLIGAIVVYLFGRRPKDLWGGPMVREPFGERNDGE